MKNNLQRSIFFGFLSWLLPLVSTFVVTPFVVHRLGAEEYGVYTLVFAFIGYSFTFSIGRAVIKYVAEFRATGETALLSEILSATLFLSLLVGGAGAILMILLAPPFVARVLQVEPHLQSSVVTAFYIAAATIALLMTQQVFSAVLQAINRYDWFAHITTALSTVLSAGNLICVFARADATTLLFWNLIVTTAGVWAFYVSARRLLPEARLQPRFSTRILKLVAHFGLGVISYQLTANFLMLFERSWIVRNFGTENLTFFAVPMTLAIYVQTAIGSLVMVLVPLASELKASANDAKFLQIYEQASKYVYFLIVYLCASLAVGSETFLRLWLGDEFSRRSSLILVFHLLAFGGIALGVVAWQTTEGTGFPQRNGWLVFVWVLIVVPLMIGLTPRFGLNGVAAARAATILATTPVFIAIIEQKTFGRVLLKFWRKTLLSLALAATASSVVLYFWLQTIAATWFNFLAANFVCGLIYLAVLCAARFFSPAEQLWFRQFFRRTLAAS